MTPLGVFARGTPSARTPDSGILRIDGDGRASLGVAQALAALVERLDEARGSAVRASDASEPANPAAVPEQPGVRDALRHLAARSRDGALLLRLLDGALVLQGVPVSQGAPGDAALERLRERLASRGVGSLTVREGAAPGELLTLARWLLRGPSGTPSGLTPVVPELAVDGGATPESAAPETIDVPHDRGGRELLRTWSIIVSPAQPRSGASGASSTTAAHAFGRLAAARSDAAVSASVALLIDTIDDAVTRGDAITIEHAARACVMHLRVIGGGAGRLALEGAVRHLMKPQALHMLTGRVAYTHDAATLLPLLARGGDAAVGSLLRHLFEAQDGMARRAYFDGIVAMDVGAALLFDSLSDPRWYVVRNAAALLGEMNVEEADVALLPLLAHQDERIRIAVARALFRLRTSAALAGLHRMVQDAHPEVRRIAAAAYGLSGTLAGRSRPAAGPLSAALNRETDDDVALEMLAALGRLGSSHAVQRLLRIALPAPQESGGDEPTTPRESWIRVAALEALIRARGNAMRPAIERLLGDSDPEVAAAAARLANA